MKAKVWPTSKIIDIAVGGAKTGARVWEGRTEGGTPFSMVVVRVAADRDHDQGELEAALREVEAPTAATEAWPTRLVL